MQNHIDLFDKALEKMNASKVEKNEFEKAL